MKNKHSWFKVDSQLQEEGLLFLAGAVAVCQCPSPIWGIIFGISYFLIVAHIHDSRAKMWRRNVLNAKLTVAGGSYNGLEAIEHNRLLRQLKKDQPKRDLFVAKFGYWLMVVVLMYQWLLLNSFSIVSLISFFSPIKKWFLFL